MNKAVFLDRDGVLNREIGDYVCSVSDFVINEGVEEVLRSFREKGYLLIVITNQGGINKKMYTHDDLQQIHTHLAETMKQSGVTFESMYYCPHHPSVTKCLCRKPGSLMLEKAMARFNIDPSVSYFIGDTDRDMEAGSAAGVTPIRVIPNANLHDIQHLVQ